MIQKRGVQSKPPFAGTILVNFGLVVLGAALFSLSFPGLIAAEGLPFLAWIAYIPVFYLLRRVTLPAALFWGALYGYASYSLFNYWLAAFHPVAAFAAASVFLVYMAVLFPILKLAWLLFPRRAYFLQWLLWLAYEYLRTLGFLGYSYGLTGYSQWRMLPLIQIADIGGVWLVSALVVFPSVFIAAALPLTRGTLRASIGAFVKREKAAAFLWLAALAAALVYGFAVPGDYSGSPRAKIALIQHNSDPWADAGPASYAADLAVLQRLSVEALAEEPGTELAVWPETAFVPRIYWHLTYRDNPDIYPIVKDLMDFLARQSVPFLIGNADARKEIGENGEWVSVNYNGALLFEKDTVKQVYRKLRLVPFTEHFPYKKQFPALYRALTERDDIHLWKPGGEETVFRSRRLVFSSPICFEDTFGYLSRNFAGRGAELLVNLSNDAWSKSVPAQTQHLSMAVFRSVENRVSSVRSTVSGQSCAIDPNGKILALAVPFTESYLNVEVPLTRSSSFYTRFGDVFGVFFTAAAILLLLIKGISVILGTVRKDVVHECP